MSEPNLHTVTFRAAPDVKLGRVLDGLGPTYQEHGWQLIGGEIKEGTYPAVSLQVQGDDIDQIHHVSKEAEGTLGLWHCLSAK